MKTAIHFVDRKFYTYPLRANELSIFKAANLLLYNWPRMEWTLKSIFMSSILFYCTSVDAGVIKPAAIRDGFSAQELNTRMRFLLEEHARLMRNVIFCVVDKRPGIDSAVSSIVENQKELGHLLNRYYGNGVGKEFSALLYKDVTRAADVMIALKNGHQSTTDKAEKKWQDSRDEILAFLTQINPSWKMYGVKKFLDDEMNCAIVEMLAIKEHDNDAEVHAFDKIRTAAQAIADTLAETIIQHFPEQFMDQSPAALSAK